MREHIRVILTIALLISILTNVSQASYTDVNNDGKVDLKDVFLIAKSYGLTKDSPKWDEGVDINKDGIVDLKDYYIMCRNFGSNIHFPNEYFDCLSWLNNSGVVTFDNRVRQGVFWYKGDYVREHGYVNPRWMISNDTRIDAQCEVAMAFIYGYKETRINYYKEKAVSLLLQARTDSRMANNNEMWMCTASSGNLSSCYTQDNGRMMRCYAIVAEETKDLRLISILTEIADFWADTIPIDGGVGIGKNLMNLNYLPDKYPSARHIGELLTGMVSAYKVTEKQSYKEASIRLGNWLVNNQLSNGSWAVIYGIDNAQNHVMEATSLSLRGLSELYMLTSDLRYKVACDEAYQWILNSCDTSNHTYSRGRLPTASHYADKYRYFNTLYMQTPSALFEYSMAVKSEDAYGLAQEILTFMGKNMTMHGDSLINGGIIGEWDLSLNQRSAQYDNEMILWGDWLFTGWTNCEFIEAYGISSQAGKP